MLSQGLAEPAALSNAYRRRLASARVRACQIR